MKAKILYKIYYKSSMPATTRGYSLVVTSSDNINILLDRVIRFEHKYEGLETSMSLDEL